MHVSAPSTAASREVGTFFSLTPEHVLDAVEQAGAHTTGLCYALNSLENRVYEVELEDERRVVAKFYRPQRWSRETILGEQQLLRALHEAEIPVCTFTFDVVEGAALVPAQNAACVFQAADCRASPGGLWGPDAASLAGEAKAIEQARAHADDASARLLKALQARFKGKPEADSLERELADLVTRGKEVCRDYDKESGTGFCASRMAQVRAAWLKSRADKLAHENKAPD